MRDMNITAFTGRMGKDAEIKAAGTKSVTTFAVAVQNDEHTDWITCVAWEKTAEAIAKFTHKGDKVGIVGRLQTRSWEQDGRKRTATEVVVDKVVFLQDRRQPDEYKTMETEDEALEELPF